MNKQAKVFLVAGLATAGLAAGFFAVNAQSGNAQSTGGPRMERMQAAQHDGDRRGPGMTGHGGMMGGPRGMFFAACHPQRDALLAGAIAYGEKRLELTPAQAESWGRLTAALRDGSARAGQSCAAAKAEDSPVTSAERLARMETRMGDGLAIVQTVRPAYETFYATLGDAQKKTLEDMLSHRMARHDGRGDRHRRHGRHDRHDRDRG